MSGDYCDRCGSFHGNYPDQCFAEFDCHCGWEGNLSGATQHATATGHDPMRRGYHLSEIDVMDLSLDAMERGDHALGIKLARYSNERLARYLEAKHGGNAS